MKVIVNSSSSQATDRNLLLVPLARLRPHPLNANEMNESWRQKLARNIEAEGGRYPPLIVRSHRLTGDYELLDGHQRFEALRLLNHAEALCFLWECDDETALRLLATLNRLEGEDKPASRAELLRELTTFMPATDLALLLPETADQIEDMLALFAVQPAQLLAELTAAAQQQSSESARLISFALNPDDEAVVERAINLAIETLDGSNRRGRALGLIARRYMKAEASGGDDASSQGI
jgi:ParB-like chromosome segregation protein Spo0J